MIYECFLLLLFVFGIAGWWLSDNINKKLFLFSGIFLLFLVCFRNRSVGIDTLNYVGFFTEYGGIYGTFTHPNEKLEPGLSLLGYLYNFLSIRSLDYLPYMICNGLLTILPLFWITRRYSINPCFSMFLIFVALRGSFMVIYVAALRQALSISFSLLSLYFLLEKKKHYKVWFAAMSIASFLFHNTGVLTTLIIIGANYVKVTKKIAYIVLASVFILSIATTRYGTELFSDLLFFLNFYTSARYEHYSSADSLGLSERSIYSAGLNLLLPLIVVYLSSEERVRNNIFIKMFIFAPSLFLLFGAFEQVSRMVAAYWIIGAIGAFPHAKIVRNSKLIWIIIIVSSFMISRAFLMYNGVEGRINGLMPYKFYWE